MLSIPPESKLVLIESRRETYNCEEIFAFNSVRKPHMSHSDSIAVVGAGTMGAGIALVGATSGLKSIQIDISEDALDKARALHAKTLARNVQKERMTQAEADAASARIEYANSLDAAAGASFAIEAASERLDLKKSIFADLRSRLSGDAILATNTSSISITEIATAVPGAEARVIGMHFFNPVPVMKLVEVIRGLATSDDTLDATLRLAESMGKSPVPANDRAGFVSNRVLMPLINEAFFAWMEGVAEPENIDEIMKLGCAHPMGPLRLADFIGLDVCHDIMMVLYRELGDSKFFPCPLLRQLVIAGRLGDKTGHGVYNYSKG